MVRDLIRRWGAVLGVVIASGCASHQGTNELTLNLLGGDAASPTSAPEPSIEASKVTKAVLGNMGRSTPESIAAWFNEPPPKDDPFAGAMEAEVREAQGNSASAVSMADLKLSPVTIAVLASFGVQTPAQLTSFDAKRIGETRRAEETCRAEIVKSMRGLGWTLITADVTNRPRASELTINGQLLGRLTSSDAPTSRQFLTFISGSLWDQSKIVTMSVDIPNPSTGRPPVRWYRDIELRRGGETKISVDVLSAPIPSIGFKPSRLLSPASVYAGDQVELFVEGGAEDTIWMVMPNVRQLRSDNYRTSPSDSDASAGLPAWFQLRDLVTASISGRRSALSGNDDPFRQIGRGVRLTWQPQYESPAAMVVAIVRGPGGYWGVATRTIAVADLRPGLWVMPNLPVDSSPEFLSSIDRAIPVGSSLNIYLTHWILGQLTYAAEVGQEVDFEVRVDDLIEASLALSTATIDFGDGSPAQRLSGSDAVRARLSHRYDNPGRYAVTLTTEDVMGLQRTQSTAIRVTAIPAPPPPAPATAPLVAPPVLAEPTRSARPANTPTTFDLMRQAVGLWSESVSEIAAEALGDRSVAVAHMHEESNRDFVDLIDHGLISALLSRELTVFEREPWFQTVIDARGLLVADGFSPRPQGIESGEALLEVAELFESRRDQLVDRWIDGLDDPLNPICDAVLDYKLKRAEVRVIEVGDIAIRTARLFAIVRIHDRATYQVLADDIVEAEVSDTVPRGEVAPLGGTWNRYPDGFMMIRVDD